MSVEQSGRPFLIIKQSRVQSKPQLILIWGIPDIYAVATDASAFQVGRSSGRVSVRHSPFLRLDVLNDRVLSGADTIITGGQNPQQFVTVTWGRSGWDGDRDVDDDAQISLYYTTMPATTTADAASND